MEEGNAAAPPEEKIQQKKQESNTNSKQRQLPVVDPVQIRKQATAPVQLVPTPSSLTAAEVKQEQPSQKQQQKRNYVCDKCRLCDEYVPKASTTCRNCGCDLVYHIRDGDESPVDDDSDPDEWNDDDEEDS